MKICTSFVRAMAIAAMALVLPCLAVAQGTAKVETIKDEGGWKLLVDGRDFPVKGVVWSYVPVGQNYAFDLWAQPDSYIERMLDTDMPLIRKMGANTIRCFSMIPPRWVSYIYDRYGIYTMVNDLFGRYGVTTTSGRWMAKTDYSDPEVRSTLLAQFKRTVEQYKDTRGVLCFMLGNESNYGLEWSSSVIENLPSGERLEAKARYLYSLFGEAIALGKSMDENHPIGIVNGDTQYLGIIAKECRNLDILGINSYRGRKAYDLFYKGIAQALDKPVVYTEIGADAFNIATGLEDQINQADFIQAQWEEMYTQAYGKGKVQNVLGAYVFEWADEWWKHGMEEGLTLHDTEGTWSNGAYDFDAIAGKNNMNEEWFGIVGQSSITENGINKRVVRAAYHVLQKIWQLDFYNSTQADIKKHFAGIKAGDQGLGAIVAALGTTIREQDDFSVTGALSTAAFLGWDNTTASNDHSLLGVQTIQLGAQWHVAEGLEAMMKTRIFGEQFYTTAFPKGISWQPLPGEHARAPADTSTIEIYQAEVNYRSEALDADFYYHTGHPDWYLEGDFFNILPEAFDLRTMDSDNSVAPFGLELRPKGLLEGLTVYGGPELYYGARHMVVGKYYRDLGELAFGLMYLEELAFPYVSDPVLDARNKSKDLGRMASLYVETDFLPDFRMQLGAMLSNTEKIGASFQYVKPKSGSIGYANSDYDLYIDNTIDLLDCLAGKLRLSTNAIPYTQLYLQGVVAGAVADSNAMLTRSGSQIADPGTGNRWDVELGAVVSIDTFAIMPKFLYRQALYDALPNIAAYGMHSAVKPRTIADPFMVYANRDAIQAEVVLSWDPTGATYLFDWNNDDRENAPLAASLSFLYNIYLGPTDNVGFFDASGAHQNWTLGSTDHDGNVITHEGLAASQGTWSAKLRVIGEPGYGIRYLFTATAGQGNSTSMPSDLLSTWVGCDATFIVDRFLVEGGITLGGWGAEQWHREFNITYPLQWNAGMAWGFGPLSMLERSNRFGIAVSGQNLGPASYPNDPSLPAGKIDSRIEFQAYINLSM